MRAGGYTTAAFMCCEDIGGSAARTGLARGFQHVEIDRSGPGLARRARTYLASRDAHPDGTPLLVWMHILEPREAAGTDNDAERYDRSLTAADAALGALLAGFANRPPASAPIVIVTSGHGEALGDHRQPTHATDLYDAQIQVPLVVAGPAIHPGRIAETVSLTDLVPTVLDLGGFVPPTGRAIDGASFADLAAGRRPPNPDGGTAFAAMVPDRSNPGELTALVHGRWKLIVNSLGFELYDIHADPHERSNLIRTRPPALDELRRLMHEKIDAAKRSPFD
jgi:arylsulfatase A-like enzyme